MTEIKAKNKNKNKIKNKKRRSNNFKKRILKTELQVSIFHCLNSSNN